MINKLRRLASAWYELPNSKGRISAMEGMRGLAVLLVFCVHYHDLLSHYLPRDSFQFRISHFFGQIGHTGVDLFFILSGYLIYGATLSPQLNVARFWRRRIERIYPTFIVVFAIYVALSIVFPDRSKFPGGIWPNTIFLGANLLLIAGLAPVQPLITVAWSLSFEIFYYLTLPLLIVLTGMRTWTAKARVTMLFCLAGTYVVLFLAGPLLSPGYWSTSRMLMFFVGILLYERLRLPKPAPGPRSRETQVIVLFATSLVIFYFLYRLTLRNAFSKEALGMVAMGKVFAIAAPFYLFNLYSFAFDGRLRRAFEWSPLRWLGNMSYSYYLIHGLAINFCTIVFAKLVPPGTEAATLYWLAIPVVLALTLAISTTLFMLVERPLSLRSGPR